MDKESVIASLQERVGETDFSAISRRSVESIIEPLMPTFADDEKVTDETWALPVALIKNFVGQSRHDIADAVKAAKAKQDEDMAKAVKDAVEAAKLEWEKGNKDPEPKPKPADPTDVDSIINKKLEEAIAGLTGKEGALGKLTDSFNTFITNFNAQRKAESEAEVKKRIYNSLEELGADKPAVIELAVEKLKIGENAEYADLLSQAKAEYESQYKRFYADGSQPFMGGGGEQTSSDSFKAFIDSKKKEADRQAEEAEALRKKFM